MDTNTELDNAIQAARTIIADTGYPPTLIDERLDLFELAWSHESDDTPQLESFAASRMAGDPATRSVIASILWQVSEFDVPLWEDDAETRQSERRAVFDRYLAVVAPYSVEDLPWLWWELHAAATIGNLERVLALGRRAKDLSSDLADLAQIARVLFLLVKPGAAADMGRRSSGASKRVGVPNVPSTCRIGTPCWIGWTRNSNTRKITRNYSAPNATPGFRLNVGTSEPHRTFPRGAIRPTGGQRRAATLRGRWR